MGLKELLDGSHGRSFDLLIGEFEVVIIDVDVEQFNDEVRVAVPFSYTFRHRLWRGTRFVVWMGRLTT